MTAKKYVFRTLAFASLFAALVFSFNWYVDPFGYFGRIPFGPHHDYEARLFKARAINIGDYDSVILGSSRADVIPVEATKKWGLRTFNAAFLGAFPEEMLYFAEHFLPDVGTVIIGIDYYMLNEACRARQPEFAVASWYDTALMGFSYHATRHSALTLKKHFQGRRPLYDPSGSRNMERQEAANATATTTDYREILGFFETGFTCDYQLSGERLGMIADLVSRLKASGSRVVTFLQPFHPALYERVVVHGQAEKFAEWRRRVREAVPDVKDLSVAPFSSPEYFYWNDPVHYTKATAEKLIDLILAAKPGQ